MCTKITKDHLNKRLLIKEAVGSYWCKPTEVMVLEASPSKEHFKLEIKRSDNTSYTQWCHKDDYKVVEDLGPALDQVVSGVVEKFNKDLRETERKAREEFHKHSTSPTVTKPSYWEHLPTSICSSDYADAPNITATNYNAEVKKQKWVHGMCNPPSPDWKKKK